MSPNPLQKRYAPGIEQAAKQVASELPAALDAQVVIELSHHLQKDAEQTGEVLSLTGYLARWRRRALLQGVGFAGIAVGAIAAGLSPFPYQQLGLATIAGGAVCLSRECKRQREEISPILNTLARIQAAQSARALVELWTNKPTSQPVQVQAMPVQPVAILPPEPIKLFDWNLLKTEPDSYPNLLIVGASGGGKTYTTERILRSLGTPIKVVTTKRKPNQWRGIEVVGTPRNFAAIEEAMQDALERMQERIELIEVSDKEPLQEWWVFDELPAIAANVKGTQEYLTAFIREARETRMRFAFLVQGTQVKTIGLEGQSDLRDNLTEVLIGKFAVERAGELVRKKKAPQSLLDWCNSQRYPLLVENQPALCP